MAEVTFKQKLNELKRRWRESEITRFQYDDALVRLREETFVSTVKRNLFEGNLPVETGLLKSMIENAVVEATDTWQRLNATADEIVARRSATKPSEDPTMRPGERSRTGVEEVGRELLDNGFMALLGLRLAISPLTGIFDSLGIAAQQGFIASGLDVPLSRLRPAFAGPLPPRNPSSVMVSDLIGAVASIPDVVINAGLRGIAQATVQRGTIRLAKKAVKTKGTVEVGVEEATEEVAEAGVKAGGEEVSKRAQSVLAQILKPDEQEQVSGVVADVFEKMGAGDAANAVRNIGVTTKTVEAIPSTARRVDIPKTLGEAIENLGPEIRRQRRGVRPEEVSRTLGAEILKDNPSLLDEIRRLAPGSIRNPEEFAAIQEALRPLYKQLGENAEAAAKGDVAALGQFRDALEQLVMIKPFDETSAVAGKAGLTAEAGRLLDVHTHDELIRKMDDMLQAGYPAELIDGNTQAALRAMAFDIAEVWKSLGERGVAEASTHAIYGGWQGAKEIYRNLLLMMPPTMAANALGVGAGASFAVLREQTAVWLGKLGVVDDAISNDDVVNLVSGIREGFINSMGKFKTVLREDTAVDVAATRLEEFSRAIPGKTGTVIRGPSNVLVATDIIAQDALRYGWAKREFHKQAVAAGMAPGSEEYALFLATSLRNLPLNRRAFDAASRFSREFTFNEPFGPLGKTVQTAVQNSPLFFTFPFIRTLTRLTQFAARETPGLNLASTRLWRMLDGSQTDQARATAELTLAHMFAISAFDLIATGHVTGDGPTEPELRREWIEAGNRPNQAFGVDLRRLEPFGTILNAYASLQEALPYMDQDERENAAMATVVAFSRALSNSFWLGDSVDLFDSLQSAINGQPDRLIEMLAAKPALTVASGGPLGTGLRNASDDVVREYSTIVEEFRARTPLASKTARGRRNGFGELVIRPKALGGPIADAIFPFVKHGVEKDELANHLLEIGFKFTNMPDSVGGPETPETALANVEPGKPYGMNTTDADKNRMLEILGEFRDPDANLNVREIMEQMRSDPEYRSMMPANQLNVMQNLYGSYRNAAVGLWKAENIERIVDTTGRSKVGAAKARISDPAERQELDNQFNELVGDLQSGKLLQGED